MTALRTWVIDRAPEVDVIVVVLNTRQGRANARHAERDRFHFPDRQEPAPGVVLLGDGDDHLVLTHELAHALVGLGDEYIDSSLAYTEQPSVYHAWAGDPLVSTANLSLEATGAKWAGVVEGALPGGMRYATGIYHPTSDCRMLDEHRHRRFCAVCSREVDHFLAGRNAADGAPRLGLRFTEPPALTRYNLGIGIDAFDRNGLDEISGDVDGVSIFHELMLVPTDGGSQLRLVPGVFRGDRQDDQWHAMAYGDARDAGMHILTVRARDRQSNVTVVQVPYLYEPTP